MNKKMTPKNYEKPEAEVLYVKIESHMMGVSNGSYTGDESDNDFFDENND